MKKYLYLVPLLCAALLFSGCSVPNSLQLDLSRGYGEHLKLLHLNASTKAKKVRMEAFASAIADCEPLEKDFSMFAYYPDYRLDISGKALSGAAESGFTLQDVPAKNGVSLSAIVDINGEYVDFYFPGDDPPVLYRSKMTAKEFETLVHQA